MFAGYEVCGVENLPENTPALIVYYHGAIPIDLYYFISRVYLLKNILIHTVADRFLFKIPGTVNVQLLDCILYLQKYDVLNQIIIFS